jgi:hypothetical protein
MVRRHTDKAVYIRETTDGKTKWVKIPGLTVMNSWKVIRVYMDPTKFSEKEGSWHPSGDREIKFEQEGRAV